VSVPVPCLRSWLSSLRSNREPSYSLSNVWSRLIKHLPPSATAVKAIASPNHQGGFGKNMKRTSFEFALLRRFRRLAKD
jgi:hypothetical protein